MDKNSPPPVTQKTPPSNPKTSKKAHWYQASRPKSQSPDYFAQLDNIGDILAADPVSSHQSVANTEPSTRAWESE